ncbi:hypothetical protein ACN38_g6834, partial [Penicillium nordicum]
PIVLKLLSPPRSDWLGLNCEDEGSKWLFYQSTYCPEAVKPATVRLVGIEVGGRGVC